jgi:hypothetical protein
VIISPQTVRNKVDLGIYRLVAYQYIQRGQIVTNHFEPPDQDQSQDPPPENPELEWEQQNEQVLELEQEPIVQVLELKRE